MDLIKTFLRLAQGKVALVGAVLALFVQLLTALFPFYFPQIVQTLSLVVLLAAGGYIICYFAVGAAHFDEQALTRMGRLIAEQVATRPASSFPDSAAVPVPTLSNAEQAYTYFASRYGIGYASLEVECTIRSDGSATIRRVVAIEAYSEVNRLDTYLLIPERIDADQPAPISLTQVRSLTPGVNVTLIDTKKELMRLSAIIAISPPLYQGKGVTYEVIEEIPARSFAIDLTEEELAQRKTPYDYFAWNINRPTRKLALRVYFPEYPRHEIYGAEVRYASASGFPAERLQYEERKNLKGPVMVGPQGGRYVMQLDVDYPMTGLIYVMHWQPLARPA